MRKQGLILLALAGLLAVLLAACGDGKVESTVSEAVSKIGEDIGGAVSRAESMLDEGFDRDGSSLWEDSSALPDESGWEDGASGGLESGEIFDDEGSLVEESRVTKDR